MLIIHSENGIENTAIVSDNLDVMWMNPCWICLLEFCQQHCCYGVIPLEWSRRQFTEHNEGFNIVLINYREPPAYCHRYDNNLCLCGNSSLEQNNSHNGMGFSRDYRGNILEDIYETGFVLTFSAISVLCNLSTESMKYSIMLSEYLMEKAFIEFFLSTTVK